MKMAAAEALYETKHERRLLDLHHRHPRRQRRGVLAPDARRCSRSWPPGTLRRQGRGHQRPPGRSTRPSTGPATTRPNIPLTYWTFRLMIGVGHVGRARWPLSVLWSFRKGRLPGAAGGAAPGDLVLPLTPLLGNSVRLDLHRDGPPAVDRVRADAHRRRASRPAVERRRGRSSPDRLHPALRRARRGRGAAACVKYDQAPARPPTTRRPHDPTTTTTRAAGPLAFAY